MRAIRRLRLHDRVILCRRMLSIPELVREY